MSAVLPDEPSDVDASGGSVSAFMPPASKPVPVELQGLSTKQLTLQALTDARGKTHALAAGSVKPMVSVSYTPAQIRAAYGLPAVAASTPVQLGAGQTIYILDAYDNPTALADLNAFSTKFGLPLCTNVAVTAANAFPLAAPSSGCDFSVIYTDSTGNIVPTAPTYDSGWAGEIALDVQWAHAIAPLARIVLVEAQNSYIDRLYYATKTINKMGPGPVSMSFGAPEYPGYTDTTRDAFLAPGYTYLAATGDNGYQAMWPAVMGEVVAVGGTSLNWSGTGTRTETAWSGAGGAVSQYVPLPSYQVNLKLADGSTPTMRAVADVSMNADPSTGQYVAMTYNGTVNWFTFGGTSMSTPMWAGFVALGNAQRAAASQPVIGRIHSAIYAAGQAATTYAQVFLDVTTGANGTCKYCAATTKYDIPTGFGTPNGFEMVANLARYATSTPTPTPTPTPPAPTPPTSISVPGGNIPGRAGAPLSYTLGIQALPSGSYTYAVSGVSGVTVSTMGVLTWAKPVLGTWNATVTVKSTTGQSASGVYKFVIGAANKAPLVQNIALSLTTAQTVSTTPMSSDPDGDALTFKLGSVAPAGLALTTAGGLTFAPTTKGVYTIRVIATDTYGASSTSTATFTVTTAPSTPVIEIATDFIEVPAGLPVSLQAVITNADGLRPVTRLINAPAGMTLSSTGLITWPKAVVGTYTVTLEAKDPSGLTSTHSFTVQANAPTPPTLIELTLAVKPNQVFAMQIPASTTNGTSLSYVLYSVNPTPTPVGLTVSSTGMLRWTKTVKGTYFVTIMVTDALGLKSSGVISLQVM
jgi:hypothetical protein